VEHEAKTVKRRATLALAHDVRTWNVNRKRELLQSCLSFARSQHEATRRSVDAWSSLRDGFIGTPVNPSIIERRVSAPPPPSSFSLSTPLVFRSSPNVEPGEASSTIYETNSSGSGSSSSDNRPTIVPVEHNILATSANDRSRTSSPENPEVVEANDPSKSPASDDPEFILPFAEANPIPEEEEEDEDHEDLMSFGKREGAGSNVHEPTESSFNDEKLSASMQSLVDGLMNWGGGLDVEEEHLALPVGMAASIVLEESANGKC